MKNEVSVLTDGTIEMVLTQGKTALIDASQLPLVTQYRWCAVTFGWTFYAATGIRTTEGKWTTLYMHRLLLPNAKEIDHINGIGTDNRLSNLRPCTTAQNQHNQKPRKGTSSYKGVYWARQCQRWRASITVHGKTRWLGVFQDEIEAAMAYDVAAQTLCGAFARTNFPNRKEACIT